MDEINEAGGQNHHLNNQKKCHQLRGFRFDGANKNNHHMLFLKWHKSQGKCVTRFDGRCENGGYPRHSNSKALSAPPPIHQMVSVGVLHSK